MTTAPLLIGRYQCTTYLYHYTFPIRVTHNKLLNLKIVDSLILYWLA
jgi:hypothetical protein